jgi:hypothetical protein
VCIRADAFAFSNLPPVLLSLLERRVSINSNCLLSWLQLFFFLFFLRRIGCNDKLEVWLLRWESDSLSGMFARLIADE